MKTTVEIEGYLIVVTGDEDRISVTATLDEEVVEEFTVEIEAGEGGEGDEDLKSFDAEEGQGADFEEVPGGAQGAQEELEDEPQLESFQRFVEKRKS